jgi:hypothetical protein
MNPSSSPGAQNGASKKAGKRKRAAVKVEKAVTKSSLSAGRTPPAPAPRKRVRKQAQQAVAADDLRLPAAYEELLMFHGILEGVLCFLLRTKTPVSTANAFSVFRSASNNASITLEEFTSSLRRLCSAAPQVRNM